MKYEFEGIGPQPPETITLNLNEFTLDQVRDAAEAYVPTHERITQEIRQRVAAIAGEYATQLARRAVQARTLGKPVLLQFGKPRDQRLFTALLLTDPVSLRDNLLDIRQHLTGENS